ncbi:hypothetical protein [Owenweeksia hongkongensis]|uniref:hypothetical protein n=1 Tax=Owenweeksia hongkongensis TaxID=253245 RepID=UPI003A916184
MDKVKVLAGLALGAMVIGCSNPAKEFKAELEAIDSLQTIVEVNKIGIDSIDVEEMNALAEEVDRQYTFVTENFKDTTARAFWVRDVSYYKGVMKTFTHFAKGQEKVKAELAENEKQLSTLKNSIEDGKLERTEVEKYLKEEVHAVQQTQMHYNKIVPNLADQRKLYKEFKPKMDSVEALIRATTE